MRGCEDGDENGIHDGEGNAEGDVGFSKVNVKL
jgi:hypothetical protein